MFCSFAGTLSHFFICALLVELFKSSYLLIYPHLVKTSSINNRAIAISGISIILNLGIVLSTLLGSYFIEYLQPSYIFILVGCMDILQMFISKSILSRNHDMKQESPAPVETRKKTADKLDFLFLCLITLFFYFAMVIIRPYYTLFLTSIYGNCINTTMAAFIFIIPNIIALGVAPFTAKFTSTYPLNSLLLGSCGLMIIGIGMQIFPGHALIIIAGRILYGIGMFMSEVIVDIRVFNLSNNQNIYKWYSYINGVQNISILIAPLVAAFIISSYGQYPLFIMSVASTLIMSVLVFVLSAYKKKEFILQKN